MILNVIKANSEIDRLKTELDSAKAEAERLAVELKTATDKAAQLEASGNETVAHLVEENEKLKASVAKFNEEVEKAASQKALTITASQGVPPVPNTGSSQSNSDIYTQYASIQDPAKRHEFWKANRKALFDYARNQHKPLNS